MENKVKIELTTYNSLAILKFCREYINDSTQGDIKFQSINDAIDEYEKQIYDNISRDQLDDALQENQVNKLIGKWPT